MAYIDRELEKVDFRVILGRHASVMNPKQLPAQATAVVIEGLYFRPKHFYSAIEDINDSGGIVSRQYPKIVERAKKTGIPIVAGEPLVEKPANLAIIETEIDRAVTSFTRMHTFWGLLLFNVAGRVIAFNTNKFNQDSWASRHLKGFKTHFGAHGLSLDLRDLIMAQRAWRFAEHQRSKGIERPLVTISCGALHFGVADKLLMVEAERLEAIKSHPTTCSYFTPTVLRRILYSQYNLASEAWKRGIVFDNNFREDRY